MLYNYVKVFRKCLHQLINSSFTRCWYFANVHGMDARFSGLAGLGRLSQFHSPGEHLITITVGEDTNTVSAPKAHIVLSSLNTFVSSMHVICIVP